METLPRVIFLHLISYVNVQDKCNLKKICKKFNSWILFDSCEIYEYVDKLKKMIDDANICEFCFRLFDSHDEICSNDHCKSKYCRNCINTCESSNCDNNICDTCVHVCHNKSCNRCTYDCSGCGRTCCNRCAMQCENCDKMYCMCTDIKYFGYDNTCLNCK